MVNLTLNVLRFVSAIFEPFMPSFSAKVNEQLGLERTVKDESLLEFVKDDPKSILSLLPAGHTIGEPQPIFREIKDEEIQQWRKAFGGNE